MRKGITITEVLVILVMVLIIAVAGGACCLLSLRRHRVSQGAMYTTQIAAQPATGTQAEQPEPEDTAKTEQALAQACFKGGSDYWIALKVSRTSTMQMPVKEKLWREISPGDYVDVDVPGKGAVSVPVVRKYRQLSPAED